MVVARVEVEEENAEEDFRSLDLGDDEEPAPINDLRTTETTPRRERKDQTFILLS